MILNKHDKMKSFYTIRVSVPNADFFTELFNTVRGSWGFESCLLYKCLNMRESKKWHRSYKVYYLRAANKQPYDTNK